MSEDPGNYYNYMEPYRNRTLREIAATDAGLLWLHEKLAWPGLWPQTREQIEAYLQTPEGAERMAGARLRKQQRSHAGNERLAEYGM
jgi:hypothetical protein